MSGKVIDPLDNLIYERDCLAQGYRLIAGIDEVGRGPLAGNVVCAAVIMDLDNIIDGITDSKKLSEKKREFLYDKIMDNALAVCIAEVSPEVIDLINIRNATRECMLDALNGLPCKAEIVLIDAEQLDTDIPNKAIIKGDLYSYTIGAASIVAKVYRDRQMKSYAEQYPEYGFEQHKGYGTRQHIDAILEYGLTPIHRRTFVKNFYK